MYLKDATGQLPVIFKGNSEPCKPNSLHVVAPPVVATRFFWANERLTRAKGFESWP